MIRSILQWSSLSLLALAGCSSEEPGVSLDFGLVHQASAGSQTGMPRTVTGPNGDIVLTRAWVTVGAVEIFACPATAWRRALELLSPIGVAHAHTEGSPTKIGVPHVDDLAHADSQVMDAGTLKPPADSYCDATVTLDPADDDAEGLPSPDMSGYTVWVEGTATPAGGGAAQAFVLQSEADIDQRVPFVSNTGSSSPVVLKEPGAARSTRVVLAYDQWFTGVDPLQDGAADALVQAIADTLRVQVQSP